MYINSNATNGNYSNKKVTKIMFLQVSLIRRLLNQVHRQYRYNSNMRRVRVLPSYKMQGMIYMYIQLIRCITPNYFLRSGVSGFVFKYSGVCP